MKIGLSLALSETPKTGFVVWRPIESDRNDLGRFLHEILILILNAWASVQSSQSKNLLVTDTK